MQRTLRLSFLAARNRGPESSARKPSGGRAAAHQALLIPHSRSESKSRSVGFRSATLSAVSLRSGLCSLLLLACGTPVLAQENLRSSFPGRRIGGATRGECSSRLIVHLVPPSSVLAPGSAGIGLLQGPSANPTPLALELRTLGRGGQSDRSLKPLLQRTLPPLPIGVTLLSLAAVSTPTVWESSYVCGATPAAAPADPLSFVEAASPPALSLLIATATAEDARIQAALRDLRQACGGTVATADLVRRFGLSDVVQSDWPARLPVRCP